MQWYGDKKSWPHWWLVWLKLRVRVKATSLGARSWFFFSSCHGFLFQAVKLATCPHTVHFVVHSNVCIVESISKSIQCGGYCNMQFLSIIQHLLKFSQHKNFCRCHSSLNEYFHFDMV